MQMFYKCSRFCRVFITLTVINFSHYHHIRQLEAILSSYISLERDSMCDQTAFDIFVDIWNALPDSVVSAPSVNVFKNRLTPILRIGDQMLTFDVFWPKHLHEVRSTVYIHVQSI